MKTFCKCFSWVALVTPLEEAPVLPTEQRKKETKIWSTVCIIMTMALRELPICFDKETAGYSLGLQRQLFMWGNAESWGFPDGLVVKNPPAMPETRVPSLGWEDPLEEGMATHSSILAWRIPWTEKPCRLYRVTESRPLLKWLSRQAYWILPHPQIIIGMI